jgi:hypothetical protein
MSDDFEELPKMAGWHESNLVVPTSKFALSAIKPNHYICLFNDGGEVCKLDFNGPELKFTGNPDEGAKVFLDFVSKYFVQRLKDEQAKELEACCELLEGMHAATDGNHNYYLHAANELRNLRKGKT